ncbi:hypothetical protein, partial [Xanthomonas nasturtii]|uniref:hypothetical protein n=1 Tax=Xanthomonas nasturtii TaxID=1843581 RepID=UPI0020113F37
MSAWCCARLDYGDPVCPNCDVALAKRKPPLSKRQLFLEPVHNLLSNSAKKAKWMNCRLVL